MPEVFPQEGFSDDYLFVVSPEPQITGFLNQQEVPVEGVYKAGFAELGVRATPTVFLADSQVTIRNVFVGQLNKSREAALLGVISRTEF